MVHFICTLTNHQVTIKSNLILTSGIKQINSWDFLRKKLDFRDLDFNANRQYFLSTCGDDGYMKFWDIRSTNEPVLSRMEHSHWVWNIRINRFHDQLVLTSSSDSRVILSSVASISSEPFGHMISVEDDSLQNAESCEKKKLVCKSL